VRSGRICATTYRKAAEQFLRMDNATRHARIGRRFLVSIIQQYGPAAPTILRRWADELEQLEADVAAEFASDDSRVDEPSGRA
jgi:hypothetical protein